MGTIIFFTSTIISFFVFYIWFYSQIVVPLQESGVEVRTKILFLKLISSEENKFGQKIESLNLTKKLILAKTLAGCWCICAITAAILLGQYVVDNSSHRCPRGNHSERCREIYIKESPWK